MYLILSYYPKDDKSKESIEWLLGQSLLFISICLSKILLNVGPKNYITNSLDIILVFIRLISPQFGSGNKFFDWLCYQRHISKDIMFQFPADI